MTVLLPATVLLAAGLALPAAWAAAPAVPPQTPPAATAVRVTTPPTVDGDVLGDPAWAAAPPIAGFWQTAPSEGAPASEPTEVRIVYTADTLYFGVVCHDRDPSGIVVSGSRRDGPLDETDAVLIVLDTYRDLQNGFVFGTNPAGLEHDGQVTNEGQGGGASGGPGAAGGSLSGYNKNWDGVWTVRTRGGDFGWSAEFAIPFRTLRYRAGGASGGSTSSATSGGATRGRSGPRSPASTTCSGSRARARWSGSSRPPRATSSCSPTSSPRPPAPPPPPGARAATPAATSSGA
jgi:hypothetical protein